MSGLTCPLCEDYRRRYNAAIANGLHEKARVIDRLTLAHERDDHGRSKAKSTPPRCCPDIPTTNIGAETLEAWTIHDLAWHGNLFLKREADGSLTRLDPTKVTVTVAPEPKPATCPGCHHTLPDPHREELPGGMWCVDDMAKAMQVGEDPRAVGPCY